jgi:hypothetical protein
MSAGDRLPAALQCLDASGRAHHCFLEPTDCCHYLWEYLPGARRAAARCWIWDLKCRPQEACAAHRDIRKQRALVFAAQALRAALPREWVEQRSWCPIPPSQAAGEGDYDDRMLRILHMAFAGYDADVRPLLRQVRSMPPDHSRQRRVSFGVLHGLWRVDGDWLARQPLRAELVLFDDVLTTGKHFKCAQARLYEAAGPIRISACFLMRRILSPQRRGLGRPEAS